MRKKGYAESTLKITYELEFNLFLSLLPYLHPKQPSPNNTNPLPITLYHSLNKQTQNLLPGKLPALAA